MFVPFDKQRICSCEKILLEQTLTDQVAFVIQLFLVSLGQFVHLFVEPRLKKGVFPSVLTPVIVFM